MNEDTSPGAQVRAGFAQLTRWANRAEVRRYLLGSDADRLSTTDAVLLEHLTKHGPMRASALAAAQGVDKSTMTLQLRRLDDRGLLDRHPDPTDRRATLVGTSKSGLALQARIGDAGAAAFDEVLATWPESDRAALGEMLTRFAAQLDQYPRPRRAASGTPLAAE